MNLFFHGFLWFFRGDTILVIPQPMTPAVSDASRMDILPPVRAAGFVKARLLIKIDMVKPIPPKHDTPKIMGHVVPSGNSPHLRCTARRLNRKMPIGLPSTNPKKMPAPNGLNRTSKSPRPSILIPALASAKMGMMKKETMWWRAYSRRCDGLMALTAI